MNNIEIIQIGCVVAWSFICYYAGWHDSKDSRITPYDDKKKKLSKWHETVVKQSLNAPQPFPEKNYEEILPIDFPRRPEDELKILPAEKKKKADKTRKQIINKLKETK